MLEKVIERHLVTEVNKYKAKALKLNVPGKNGVPDRLILIKGGRTVFVELKRPGKALMPLQQKRADELRDLDFEVYHLDTIEAVDSFMTRVFRGCEKR